MEDTLRGRINSFMLQLFISLNPCFNGRYSQSNFSVTGYICKDGLNPCFNGRYSQRPTVLSLLYFSFVLILVLMEDTLRGYNQLGM